MIRPKWIAFLLLGALAAPGCITRPGGQLSAIEPEVPSNPPAIEYTVGDYEFTLEGGKMITSNKAGRNVSNEIFKVWKKRGYISEFSYVKSGEFSGNTEHRLTLSGSQYGDSSLVAQFLSGLTLLIIPYTVDSKFDIQYSYRNESTGAECSAEVSDSYYVMVELFLFVVAPFARNGANETYANMADHIYAQLHENCGFGKGAPAS